MEEVVGEIYDEDDVSLIFVFSFILERCLCALIGFFAIWTG